ncbi:MAG: hypothetical protein HY268_03465 [Deltaproteobacteria bacterium]|nr:hypothetical protein [Deltaproteobacteria bacterium]
MSSFLVNLARRGAGLPTTPIQVPASPLGPGIRQPGDELTEVHETGRSLGMTEEPTTGNAASQTPLRASGAAAYTDLPSQTVAPRTPSIQRFSGTEYRTPVQPSVGEPAATTKTPSLGPPSAPQLRVVSPRREEVEHARPTPSPVAQTIEPMGALERQASTVAPTPPILIREPGETQVVSPTELSPEQPRDGAQETRAPALSAATIRPALAEFPTLLQFPQVTPASSPTPPAQLPIHVRIGRVEVRGTPAPTPTPARPSPAAPLGFDSYYRVRTYRS